MELLKQLGLEYVAAHDSQEDLGCKSSCRSWEAGYRPNLEYTFDKTPTYEFYFRFGGYCIGDCSRWHEVVGKTESEVIEKTRVLLKDA